MSFQDTLRKNLTPELFTQVCDQLGDDFDYDLVPRTRLNKVISQRNKLRDQLAGTPQPQKVNHDEDDDDIDPLTTEQLDAIKQQYKKEQDDAIMGVKIQYAALEKLRAANALDPELLWNSGVIDRSKLSLDDTGALVGMDDCIAQLQKDKPHQFQTKKSGDDGVPAGTGKEGGEPFKGITTKGEFLKLSVDQQLAFKQAHPEVFKSFMNAQ